MVCGLPEAHGEQCMDRFKLLGIDKCPYEIPKTDDSVRHIKWRRQHGYRKLLANDVTVILYKKYLP